MARWEWSRAPDRKADGGRTICTIQGLASRQSQRQVSPPQQSPEGSGAGSAGASPWQGGAASAPISACAIP